MSAENRWEGFAESARLVMERSEAEVRRLNHNYIGTEHILLGILGGESNNPEVVAFRNLGVDLNIACTLLDSLLPTGPKTSGPRSLTPRARRVVERAVEEWQTEGGEGVTSVHLLKGLLSEEEGWAAQVLEGLNTPRNRILQELTKLQQKPVN